jgi:hypothetical protein
MPFQLPSHEPIPIKTSSLGVLLFPPFLVGSLVAFESALGDAATSPDDFVKQFSAIQARKPSDDDDINMQYENGDRIDATALEPEDVREIAGQYLRSNESEMAWYASGDQVIELEDNKWQPAQNVARNPSESDAQYFKRLAQECVSQSSTSLKRITESFKSISDMGNIGRFALADLNATLSANRIRVIASSPSIKIESLETGLNRLPMIPTRWDDAVVRNLETLIIETQRVSSLIAEQCESARNQNIKTDLLIEASNRSSSDAAKSLKTADDNLKWAKVGILATTVFSLLSLIQSVIASGKQGVDEAARAMDTAQIMKLANSSQESLSSINKSIVEINRRISSWPGATKR